MPKKKASKEDKIFENLSRVTLQFMQGKTFVPLTEKELSERLHVVPLHEKLFHQVLNQLVQSGQIERKRGRYSCSRDQAEVVQGVIRMHPRGFGFVQVEEPAGYDQDIFIPKHLTQGAVDGDRVEALVNTEVVSEKGPEGRVIAITERTRTHIGGVIAKKEQAGPFLAYVPLLGESQQVIVEEENSEPVQIGDRVIMEVLDWGSRTTATRCRVTHHLGHIDDASADIPAAIEEFSLRADFPNATVLQARTFGNKVPLSEIKTRKDFRNVETITIDPETAKDFDDALSLQKDKKGHYHLTVHIADVSHYVQLDGALDKEAKLRCNSTYFPGECIPMLPSELSNNLCSLRPNVNRLTISVIMELDPKGEMLRYEIVRGVIKSNKRFTYGEAKKVLDGDKKSPHAPTLELMVELCHHFKRQRYERGNIEFALPESVILVDDKGEPKGTKLVPYDITHQLVEEFMLKANELVATHLTRKGLLLTYRIHDSPLEDNLKDFADLVRIFGFDLPDKPSPQQLQKLFEEASETSYGSYLATAYIRKMRLAIYSPENIGHYGLGLEHYCHFTSPIRRYADLVVHRILFGDMVTRDELELISRQCSDQERLSAKAEMHVVQLKKLRLLQSRFQEEPRREYEAVVTSVKPFGVFFEIADFMIEGFLHVSDLADDYYLYDEPNGILKGRRSNTNYHAGDKILVMLKSVDLIYLESKWYLVDKLTHHIQPTSRPGRSRKRPSPSAKKKKGSRRKKRK